MSSVYTILQIIYCIFCIYLSYIYKIFHIDMVLNHNLDGTNYRIHCQNRYLANNNVRCSILSYEKYTVSYKKMLFSMYCMTITNYNNLLYLLLLR